jgi:hypothetical protein
VVWIDRGFIDRTIGRHDLARDDMMAVSEKAYSNGMKA